MELGTLPDHVHLLVDVDVSGPPVGKGDPGPLVAGAAGGGSVAALAVAAAVDQLDFVATVGGAPLSVIKRYVETQKAR